MGKELLNSNKELLLKDLCARLPYKVYAQIPDEYGGYTSAIESIDIDGFVTDFEGAQIEIENIKPYLFPLSSMTEEQFKEMQEIIGNPNEACISVNTSGLELWLNSVDTDPTIWLDTLFEVQDWLNAHHFDYKGLIPMGLAIDATGLNIY